MRIIWKAAIAAVSFGVLAGCQPYDYYDDGYYGGSYGYCDAYGCPGNYWDMPVYYGSVYYGGSWLNGPFYYRDYDGRRQFWLRGGWRDDAWRGARPPQYRDGRFGPPLGRDWYRNNRSQFDRDGRPGYQGRGGDFRGRDGDGGPRQGQPPRQSQSNPGPRSEGPAPRTDTAPRGSTDGRALTPPDRRFGR